MDPVQSTLVRRKQSFAKHFWRQKGGGLSAEIMADLNDLHAIRDRSVEGAQVLQPGVGQLLVQVPDIFRLGCKGEHPSLEPALTNAVEQLVRRSKRGNDRFICTAKESRGCVVMMFESEL